MASHQVEVEAPKKEVRKPLTEKQRRSISETQGRLAQARALAADAEREASQVLELVFDALGIAEGAQVSFDEKAGELVVVVE